MFFQTSIPVNYSEFVTHIPEYFIYNPNSKGYIFLRLPLRKSRILLLIIIESKDPGRSITTKSSQEKTPVLETNTTYLAENLPAMKEEVFVNIDNYTARSVSHELSMTKFPNQPLSPTLQIGML
jgi:hypothetical protein